MIRSTKKKERAKKVFLKRTGLVNLESEESFSNDSKMYRTEIRRFR